MGAGGGCVRRDPPVGPVHDPAVRLYGAVHKTSVQTVHRFDDRLVGAARVPAERHAHIKVGGAYYTFAFEAAGDRGVQASAHVHHRDADAGRPALRLAVDAEPAGHRLHDRVVAGVAAAHLPPRERRGRDEQRERHAGCAARPQHGIENTQAERVELGALARDRLAGLMRAAPAVVLSWPETAGDEALRPSPLVAEWAPRSGGVECPQPQTWGALLIEAGTREPLAADRLGPVTGPQSGGMAVLADQSRCPFRAAAVHRLSAESLATPVPGMDPRIRGTWVHAALRRLWAHWGSRQAAAALDPADRARQIEAAVHEAEAALGVASSQVAQGSAPQAVIILWYGSTLGKASESGWT